MSRTPEVTELLRRLKQGRLPPNADAYTLAAEVECLEAEVEFYKRHGQEMTDVGNGLYRAIVARLEPHLPAGSRDLEWDVLPGTVGALAKRAEAAEARVKELEIVRDALIRSEESAQQLEELVSNQAQEYIERAEAAEQRAEESERAFGLLEEAHKSTTEQFASMMARVAELERCLNYEQKDNCDLEDRIAALEAELNELHTGKRVVLPVDRHHAEAMVRVAGGLVNTESARELVQIGRLAVEAERIMREYRASNGRRDLSYDPHSAVECAIRRYLAKEGTP